MGRGKKRQADTKQIAEKAQEIRDQAQKLAGHGSEAVREFADTTGAAAKQFARTAFEAAKDLLETVERAEDRLEERTKPKKRRGRKVMKAGLAIGAGAALFANEKVRNTIMDKVSGGGEPGRWEPTTDGEFRQAPVSQTTP